MHEMPRSFNFLSIRQQIMYTRPCHLVPLCLGGFVEMAELGAIQLVQIKNFNYFQVFALFWFQTRYLPFKFWFIGILCFSAAAKVACNFRLAQMLQSTEPPLKTLHTAKVHKTLLHWIEDPHYKVLPFCTTLWQHIWRNMQLHIATNLVLVQFKCQTIVCDSREEKKDNVAKRIYELGQVPRRQEEKGKPKPQGHSSKKAGVSGNHQIIRMLNNQANIHQPPCWLKVINLQFKIS